MNACLLNWTKFATSDLRELNVDKEVIYSPYGPKNEFFVVNNWAELTRVPAMKVLT